MGNKLRVNCTAIFVVVGFWVCAMETDVSAQLKLYVTNFGSGTVSVIDTATNSVISTIRVGRASLGVSASPDGSRLYVASAYDGTISVISTETNTIVATILVGKKNAMAPFDVDVTPDGTKIYVTNSVAWADTYTEDSRVSVIDSRTNTVIATIPITGDPRKLGSGSTENESPIKVVAMKE